MKIFFPDKDCCPGLRLNLKILLLRSTLIRALRVAFIVGIVLNISNNFQDIIYRNFEQIGFITSGLAFLVPYLVSSYSTIVSQTRFHPGDVSPVDAMLHCSSCHQFDFNISAGDEIDQCPSCSYKMAGKENQFPSPFGG